MSCVCCSHVGECVVRHVLHSAPNLCNKHLLFFSFFFFVFLSACSFPKSPECAQMYSRPFKHSKPTVPLQPSKQFYLAFPASHQLPPGSQTAKCQPKSPTLFSAKHVGSLL